MRAGAEIRTADTPAPDAGSAASASPVGADRRATEPCLHCGFPVSVRLMGCKGGHCPNCRHPYPHGDCSD